GTDERAGRPLRSRSRRSEIQRSKNCGPVGGGPARIGAAAKRLSISARGAALAHSLAPLFLLLPAHLAGDLSLYRADSHTPRKSAQGARAAAGDFQSRNLH